MMTIDGYVDGEEREVWLWWWRRERPRVWDM